MPHSFGKVVDLAKIPLVTREEVKDMGIGAIAVELLCVCMDSPHRDQRNPPFYKPWAEDEYEVLSEREYAMLIRYHNETCSHVKNDTKDISECHLVL
jgi:hypothetical protein